jgi:hypothetical protein
MSRTLGVESQILSLGHHMLTMWLSRSSCEGKGWRQAGQSKLSRGEEQTWLPASSTLNTALHSPHARLHTHTYIGPHIISVSDPDWIRIQSGQWFRIRIQEDKNEPKKLKIISCFDVLDVLF